VRHLVVGLLSISLLLTVACRKSQLNPAQATATSILTELTVSDARVAKSPPPEYDWSALTVVDCTRLRVPIKASFWEAQPAPAEIDFRGHPALAHEFLLSNTQLQSPDCLALTTISQCDSETESTQYVSRCKDSSLFLSAEITLSKAQLGSVKCIRIYRKPLACVMTLSSLTTRTCIAQDK
jgi:hypothetical protein